MRARPRSRKATLESLQSSGRRRGGGVSGRRHQLSHHSQDLMNSPCDYLNGAPALTECARARHMVVASSWASVTSGG